MLDLNYFKQVINIIEIVLFKVQQVFIKNIIDVINEEFYFIIVFTQLLLNF